MREMASLDNLGLTRGVLKDIERAMVYMLWENI